MMETAQAAPIPVSEIFLTIQGEGQHTGTPAIFVRTQGCPVGCPWCDTKYTWEADTALEVPPETLLADAQTQAQWSQLTPDDILSWCTHNAPQCKYVVITGGEPYLHNLAPLTTHLADAGYSIQIETSGTFPFSGGTWVWHTVSPKINMPGGYQVRRDCLENADEIKHPVGKEQDLENLATLLADVRLKAGTKVWLQPLSQSPKATALCAAACKEKGYYLSVQTHKYADVR